MALKYEIKKTVFGFDKTKTAKYVARPVSAGVITFADLCDQVTQISSAHRGVVKMVLDGLIDAMEMNMKNGMNVRLGEFGSFRPTFGASAQLSAATVSTQTLKRRKIVFAPGEKLKDMIQNVSIQKFSYSEGEKVTNPVTPTTPTGDTGGGTGTGTGGGFE